MTDNRSLVTCPASFSLPVAKMRLVFNPKDVEDKYAKLEREHESLRATYQRMIDRGPERFQMKPSSLPTMDSLYTELPNFTPALDDIKRHIALTLDSEDFLEITPLLLLGKPGIGKTHFAKRIAELLGTGMTLVPMSSMTAGWILSGSSSQWKGAKPGKVFESLVDGQYANPVIVVDEIDKASRNAQYDPLGSLYSLLEHDTAKTFIDEFAEVPVDASQVIWITTANDERLIPEPILNRMNVFEIEPPSHDDARKIALSLYRSICNEHGWGERFEKEPSTNVLDQLAELSPREMRRSLMTAFGNARLAKRFSIRPCDLPTLGNKKSSMGFIQ